MKRHHVTRKKYLMGAWTDAQTAGPLDNSKTYASLHRVLTKVFLKLGRGGEFVECRPESSTNPHNELSELYANDDRIFRNPHTPTSGRCRRAFAELISRASSRAARKVISARIRFRCRRRSLGTCDRREQDFVRLSQVATASGSSAKYAQPAT